MKKDFAKVLNIAFSPEEREHLERGLRGNQDEIENETVEDERRRIESHGKYFALLVENFGGWNNGQVYLNPPKDEQERFYMELPLNFTTRYKENN